MSVLANYKDCSTAGIYALDLQLIRQVQRIAPDALVSFAHLSVNLGEGCHAYLQAPAVRSLELAIKSRPGYRMTVNSAYRTLAQQCILFHHYQQGRCGITAAAAPGKSNHNTGLALDVEDPSGWRGYLEKHSWDWLGSWDKWHFDYKDGTCKDLRWISVKAFQQLWNFNYADRKITEDGEFGGTTHQCLLLTPDKGFPKTPSGALIENPFLFPSLREGMTGDSVRKLQQALTRKGIIVDADGIFGESTLRAVQKYQKKTGLDSDGVVGIATIQALHLNI